jgi:hypothetical protein
VGGILKMAVGDPVFKLVDQLLSANSQSYEEVGPEVVIYPETHDCSRFLGIKSVTYDSTNNRIIIHAMNLE